MHLAHYFVFCHVCIAQAGVSLNVEHLYDISQSKQTMQNSKRQPELHYGISTSDDCNILQPEQQGKPAVHLIDFRETYPIVLFKFIASATVETAGKVAVFIDKQLCAQPDLKNGTNMLSCSRYLKGRMLAIKSYVHITVCSVQVFTCAAGTRGPACTEMCGDGTYGISCKPCRCHNNDFCRKTDGFCPSGCDKNTDKNYDCYHKSVSRRDEHFTTIVDATAMQFMLSSALGMVYLKTRTESYLTGSLACSIFKSYENNRSVILQIPYKSSIIVYSVVITYCKFDISPPYSIHITVDGKSCFGTTRHAHLRLGTHTFICQRKSMTGNVVSISHTSYDLNHNKTQAIGLNRIRVLGCAKGFYGPKCKLQCNCLGSTCDSVNGYCSTHLCQRFARGRNCASINVAQPDKILVKSDIKDVSYSTKIYYICTLCYMLFQIRFSQTEKLSHSKVTRYIIVYFDL